MSGRWEPDRRCPEVVAEWERRTALVRVTLRLERGSLEDLEVLCRYHYGSCSRSEAVRRAVTWLLAREAMQVIRGHEIDRRRGEKAAAEARLLAAGRERVEAQREQATVATALTIANGSGPTGAVGFLA